MPSRSTPTRARDLIRAHVASDEGAARLGEVALVDKTSRVGRTGLVFYDTLFDENAASHIALGDAIVQAVARRRGADAGGTARARHQPLEPPHRLHDRQQRGRDPRRDPGRRRGADPRRGRLGPGLAGSPPTLPSAGRSSAWLERLLWEQKAGGSNPPVPISVRELDLRDDAMGSHTHQNLARSCVSTTELFRAIVTHVARGDPDRPGEQLVVIGG